MQEISLNGGHSVQLNYVPSYHLTSKVDIKKLKANEKNSSICHIENYIQMKKLNCILKTCFKMRN